MKLAASMYTDCWDYYNFSTFIPSWEGNPPIFIRPLDSAYCWPHHLELATLLETGNTIFGVFFSLNRLDGPWTRMSKMTPVFTARVHGPWIRVVCTEWRVKLFKPRAAMWNRFTAESSSWQCDSLTDRRETRGVSGPDRNRPLSLSFAGASRDLLHAFFSTAGHTATFPRSSTGTLWDPTCKHSWSFDRLFAL